MHNRFKDKLYQLVRHRMILAELEATGVDCSEELSEVNAEIEKAKERFEACDVIASYQKKKRWPANNLSDGQKKKVRDHKGLNPETIAETIII